MTTDQPTDPCPAAREVTPHPGAPREWLCGDATHQHPDGAAIIPTDATNDAARRFLRPDHQVIADLEADVRRLTTERDALQAAADRLSLDAGAARANHRDAYRELQNTATRYRDALTRITAMPAPGTFTPGAAGYLARAVDIASEALAPDAGKRWTDRLQRLEAELNHYRDALHAIAHPVYAGDPNAVDPVLYARDLIHQLEDHRKDDDPDREPQDEPTHP